MNKINTFKKFLEIMALTAIVLFSVSVCKDEPEPYQPPGPNFPNLPTDLQNTKWINIREGHKLEFGVKTFTLIRINGEEETFTLLPKTPGFNSSENSYSFSSNIEIFENGGYSYSNLGSFVYEDGTIEMSFSPYISNSWQLTNRLPKDMQNKKYIHSNGHRMEFGTNTVTVIPASGTQRGLTLQEVAVIIEYSSPQITIYFGTNKSFDYIILNYYGYYPNEVLSIQSVNFSGMQTNSGTWSIDTGNGNGNKDLKLPESLQNTKWAHRDGDKIEFGTNTVKVIPAVGSSQDFTLKDTLPDEQLKQVILYFGDNQTSDFIVYRDDKINSVGLGGVQKTGDWTKE
jgi:hypothetical protein